MNMNEALQQSLYDKLSREQDKYRDWLKGQPPEEILHHSYEYTVREQGELDVYRASFCANVSCKDAIEAAIRDNYHDNRLDAAAVGQVAEQFGQERMLYVLAATVRHFDYDGRISRDNKAPRDWNTRRWTNGP